MSEIQENKQKYAFNHDETTLCGGVGISDERMEKLIKMARIAFFTEDDAVHSMEQLLNNAQCANMVEAAVAGYCLGIIRGQELAGRKNPLAALLQQLGGDE